MEQHVNKNPLGSESVNGLLLRFAIPSIISMLVGSLYNIVDQFFIGQTVGELGNAATNISFPLSISCVAIGLLFGIGGSSAFNLSMGRGERDLASVYMGNALTMLVSLGTILMIVTQLFLKPMLVMFGSSQNVLGYAMTYTRIVSIGFPFVILATGGGHLIRADGSPKMTMICNMSGALINVVLDYIFVFKMGWKMSGAAWATVAGQVISAIIAICYLTHTKTAHLKLSHLLPKKGAILRIMALGSAPCSNQLAMMVVQIAMNNSLKHYGALSIYGEDIPIACVGIISKVNMVFMSFIIGTSQGLQPIVSFNYGAKQYDRVKEAYRKAITVGFVMAFTAFLIFQIMPNQIISIFGKGSDLYYSFSVNYFRIFLFFTFANFLQPISSNYFTAVGKPKVGMLLSLSRQIILLLPLVLILPLFMGIDGIMYAGPVADGVTVLIIIAFMIREFRRPEYANKNKVSRKKDMEE